MTEEQETETKLKKEHSYTYWVDSKNKSRDLPQQHLPQKVQIPQQISPVGDGRSNWNTSGTWQQRTVSPAELNKITESSLKQWLQCSNCDFKLKSIELEGDFKRIFSNNKRKIMYEITGSIKFESEEDLEIKVIQLTDSGDRQYDVKGKDKDEKKKLSQISEGVIDNILKEFNKLKG